MPELVSTTSLNTSAERVWQAIADFGGIHRWWPVDVAMPIERVTVEGQGIGMIRHIHLRGAGQPVSERLELLDSSTHTLVLSLVGERPMGLTAYLAEGHVVPVSALQCR